jgi:cytidylate kinase-like protein
MVAEHLGFLYADEEVIVRAAARGGLDVERVEDVEKRKSLFAGLLTSISLGEGGSVAMAIDPPLGIGEPAGENVRTFIREAIQEIVEHGNAVIVAHAASFAVGSRPDVLRVLITAPLETRSKRLAAADGMGEQQAEKAVRRSDAGRADYLKRFYGVAAELPTHYDLIVNTDTISLEQAAELIVQAASGTAGAA